MSSYFRGFEFTFFTVHKDSPGTMGMRALSGETGVHIREQRPRTLEGFEIYKGTIKSTKLNGSLAGDKGYIYLGSVSLLRHCVNFSH